MILYSIIPAEVVFQDMPQSSGEKHYEADYKGERVEVVHQSEQEYRIVRLLGTNPKAYLDPSFEPGSIVNLSDLRLH